MLNPLARYAEVQQATGRKLLPITLISGFLGAGKTTLLNSLLTQANGRRLAVLVNDFGALNIDAKLIVKVEGQTMELANGCICCTIRDDLVAGVKQLLETQPPPEQLLIETSGVSDPLNILCTFNTSKVRRQIYLENVVTVVDALHALDALDQDWAALFARQITGAYMIVLNRVDAAGPERVREVRALIEKLLPGASIVETADGTVPLTVALGEQRLGQSSFRLEPTVEEGAHPFDSLSFVTRKPIRRMEFLRLMRALASTVYRAKGIINFHNYPLTTLFQKVGSYQSFVDGPVWGVERRSTELVLIGAARRFDRESLLRQLEACCAPDPSDQI
ncbi:MAG: CobW family GTP-binding protein [Panacagrimonas sp.]